MVSRLKGEKSEGGCEASFLAGERSGLTNPYPSLDVQFDDVLVLKDEVAVDHLALERQRVFPPDPGILEFFEKVLVDGPGQVDDRGPSFQGERVVTVGLFAGDFAVSADDVEKQKYSFSQVFAAVAAVCRV